VLETKAAGERRVRPGLTLGAVCAAIVLVPVTATGASVALPSISADLHTSLSAAQWVVNAFFLTFASFMAITGSLADLTGRRRMFAGGVALFCAAMLVATFAPNIAVLITARVIAGMGAAAATTGGSALLAHAFKGEARTKAFGAFGTAIGLGLAFGPLVAGALTSAGGWRLFFLVAAVVLLPVLALTPLLTESKDAHPAGPDWPGAITFTVGLSLFVLGLVEAPSIGWTNPLVLAAFVAFVILLGTFIAVEKRRSHPLIDVTLFTQPKFVSICAMPVLLAFGFVALLIVLPPYFVAVDGLSTTAAGLLLVLLTGPTLVVPLVVSQIAHRVSRRLLLVLTMAFVAAGAAWLTVIHPHAGIGVLAGPLIALGIGFGISLAILDGAAVSSVEPARAGMAAGVFNTMRLTGESVSIAVLGALLAAVTEAGLSGQFGTTTATNVTAQALQGNMSGAIAAVTTDPARADAVRTAAATAYTNAMHVGLWAIAALSLLGGIVVGFLAGGGTPQQQAEQAAAAEEVEVSSSAV
jgi:MFS family permease